MRRDEYQTRKQQLDEQLRTGIELLHAAHRRQVEALDVLWSDSGDEPAENRAAPPMPPARQKTGELYGHVVEALAKVPQVFTREDVLACLGYRPNRASLYGILQHLIGEGVLATESRGEGRALSRYRKTKTATSPAEG